MDVYAPYDIKFNKRIKLEHSYAREIAQFNFPVREEDPLKIYPEDLDNIKKETEDEETIIIKSEPGNNVDDCQCSTSQTENCDNQHAEKTLMEVVSSEPCESAESNFFANLGLLNLNSELNVNCEVEIDNSTNLPGSNNPANFVPRHVFQDLQRMYDKAIADVKVLNKKLANEKQKKISRSSKNANNSRTLKNDIKKLKNQLTDSKSKEQLLKRTLDIRLQEDVDLKKNNMTLKSQLEDLIKLNKDRTTCINDLKQQLHKKDDVIRNEKLSLKQQLKVSNQKKKISDENFKKLKDLCAGKDAQRKDLEIKCALLSQNLFSCNTKLALQQKELEKLKLDIDIMDRSIIDSVKTRQSLKDQLTHIEKEFEEMKENPVLMHKLQEAQRSLISANKRIEEVQKQVEAEKKSVSFLLKEKAQLLKEHSAKYKQVEVQKNLLQVSLVTLKKTTSQRMQQWRAAVEECGNLRSELEKKRKEILRMQEEMKAKEEEFKSKECEYCGF